MATVEVNLTPVEQAHRQQCVICLDELAGALRRPVRSNHDRARHRRRLPRHGGRSGQRDGAFAASMARMTTSGMPATQSPNWQADCHRRLVKTTGNQVAIVTKHKRRQHPGRRGKRASIWMAVPNFVGWGDS